MDFNEYQKQALTTALPTALNLDYLVPGLIAEVGEVFGKEAKAVRDGWAKGRLDREVCAELGDVLWFIAVIAHTIHAGDVKAASCLHDDLPFVFDSAANLMAYHPNKSDLNDLLSWVECEAKSYGSTLEAVAQSNLDKLADRQARNVIAGSGDSR